MAKQVELNKQKGKGISQGENRLVWNNVQRLNNQNKFVLTAVLTKTGRFPINAARQKISSQAASTSTTRKVNTSRPSCDEISPINKIFNKSSSPIRRPFNRTIAPKANFSNQKVNTAEVKAVSVVGDMKETADTLQSALKNKGIVDSGCSRHMTGNKAYLVEYQDYNGGLVTFGGSKSYITGKGPKGSREIQEWPETPQQNRTAERKNRNLTPVRSENQANKTAGLEEANHSACIQDNIDAGYSEMEADPAQGYFVLPICSYTSTVKSSEAKNEGTARATSTNTVNTIRTPISTASPLNVFSASIPALNNNDQYDSQIPAREDIYDSPSDGIFTNASYERGRTVVIQDSEGMDSCRFALWEEAIRTKWFYRNKKDERGVVVKNKTRIFLAFDSYMGFIVYQIDVKSAFLYGTIDEEVYRRGTIDKTLFIKKDKNDIMLVQVYMDDIIFGSIKRYWCDEFEALMKSRFQMSSMGELTFFLGLQVKQKEDGIFMSQDKYVAEILKKFQFTPKTHITCCEEDLLGILKAKPLWQPRKSSFDMVAYSDSDYVVLTLTEIHTKRKLNCCYCILLRTSLVDTEPDVDYGLHFMNTRNILTMRDKICIVKKSSIFLQNKASEIRHHIIRDAYEKKLIRRWVVDDMMTFEVVGTAGTKVHTARTGSPEQTTSALAIPGQTATGKESSNPLMADSLPKTIQSNDPPLSRGYTLGSGEDSLELMELMAYCTNLCEFETTTLCTMEDGVPGISATIDRKVKVLVSEASIRRHLKLEDSEGLSSLPNAEIFEQLANMGSLIPLSHGSFDVIVGMDWLSKRKFVIVCHEKVVRISLEGDEILRVHGERTQGVVKTLMNTKVDESKLSDISVV
ncbi:putative ribonuclease H-like domain-containing protein [Tanacetum coccineum]